MDPIKVLKRAWEITWQYRALWIFGIIVALVTANAGPGNAGGDGRGPIEYRFDEGDLPFRGGEFPIPEITPEIQGVLIAVGIGLACLIVLLAIAATVARYVAETALIRMVDDYEETGQKYTVRQGFRIGWSRTALRIFLIKLLIDLPTALVLVLLFALAAAPLLLWITKNTAAGVIGTVAAIGLFLLTILLAIVVGVVISALMRFFWRACALEGLGVIESIREGFAVVRRHLKDVAIMWLIMVGVQIGLAIAMIPVVILLIPAIILLIIIGGVLGGLPALLVGGLASLVFEGAVPWIVAGVVGFPIFILVVAAPWVFLSGLVEVFKSSVWTLTYRELHALEGLETETEKLPEIDIPGLE